MRKLQALTKKELISEVEQRVRNARQEFYDFGWENHFKDCIIRMLDSGAHPQFIAKITGVDLEHVLELANNSKNCE